MRLQSRIALGYLALSLIACSTISPSTQEIKPRSGDFSIQYKWAQGSLPPPFHYEYSIRIGPTGEGQLEMIPDYPGDHIPVWIEPFTVSQGNLEKLFQLMSDQGLFTQDWRPQVHAPVGGSSEWLAVTAGGQRIDVPASVAVNQAAAAKEIYVAINALVPQAVWDKLNTQHDRYIQEHLRP